MTKITISKWGNSSAIRLPRAVMLELGFQDGETVDLIVTNGQAILAKSAVRLAPSLAAMVADINRLGLENEPETIDWGPDVGSERFYEHD